MSHMASERNPLGDGQHTPRPRTLVWDLFGDHLRYVGDGRIPMRALSALLSVFGVGDSTSRVMLARMRRERWFDTDRSGRLSSYALTGRALALLDEGRSRIFGRETSAWDGLWRMVIYAVPEPDRSQRDQLRKVLGWHGFGPLASATWISPHPRLDVIAAALQERSTGRFDLLESRALDRAADREMARRCWDLDGLAREYTGSSPGTRSFRRSRPWPRCPGIKPCASKSSSSRPTGPCPSAIRTCPANCCRRAGPAAGSTRSSSPPTTRWMSPRTVSSAG